MYALSDSPRGSGPGVQAQGFRSRGSWLQFHQHHQLKEVFFFVIFRFWRDILLNLSNLHFRTMLKCEKCWSLTILNCIKVLCHNHICWVIIPKYFAIVLNYAQIYVGILCQGLVRAKPYRVVEYRSTIAAVWSNTQISKILDTPAGI